MSALDYARMVREERQRAARELRGESERTEREAEKPSEISQRKVLQHQKCPLNVASNILSLPLGWSIKPYSIAGFDGLYYVPESVSGELEAAMMLAIMGSDCPWEKLRGRQLQQWGTVPGKLREDMGFSPWLSLLSNELVQAGIFPAELGPNNALINLYEFDEGILHHTDGPMYHNHVAVLSLGSDCIITFKPKLAPADIGVKSAADVVSVVLKARSLFVFSKDWYDKFLHGIYADHCLQVIGAHGECVNFEQTGLGVGEKVERRRRISVTLRTVLEPQQEA